MRFGDFFGPKPGNSWFSQGMVKPHHPVKSISYPGGKGIGHDWAYLPDASETFAQLMDREADVPAFARFHFRGVWDADGTQMIEAIRRAAGKPSLPVRGCLGSSSNWHRLSTRPCESSTPRVHFGILQSSWTTQGWCSFWGRSRTPRSTAPWRPRCAVWVAFRK